MVVIVCSMKKSEKVQQISAFQNPRKKLGLGHDISFAIDDKSLRRNCTLSKHVLWFGTFAAGQQNYVCSDLLKVRG
jgi:hypothetical protein